jgi:hypothetical protein
MLLPCSELGGRFKLFSREYQRGQSIGASGVFAKRRKRHPR